MHLFNDADLHPTFIRSLQLSGVFYRFPLFSRYLAQWFSKFFICHSYNRNTVNSSPTKITKKR